MTTPAHIASPATSSRSSTNFIENTSMNNFQLMNGEDFAARYPESFEMPPLAERQTLKDRDLAKLGFVDDPAGERMWVLVEGRDAAGNYVGTLNNAPVVITTLRYGDAVTFRPEHVIEIDRYVDFAEQVWSPAETSWLIDLCSCAPVYVIAQPEHAHQVKEMVDEIFTWFPPRQLGRNTVGTAHCAELYFGDFGDAGSADELGHLHAEARTPEHVAHAIAHPNDDNGQRPYPWVLTFDGTAWQSRQLEEMDA